MPLVPGRRRHRQMDLSEVEFKASLAYRESYKTTRAVIQRNTKTGGRECLLLLQKTQVWFPTYTHPHNRN